MHTNQPGMKTLARLRWEAQEQVRIAQERRESLAKQQRFLASIAPKS